MTVPLQVIIYETRAVNERQVLLWGAQSRNRQWDGVFMAALNYLLEVVAWHVFFGDRTNRWCLVITAEKHKKRMRLWLFYP